MNELAGHAVFPLNPGIAIQPKLSPISAWTGHIPFAGWLVHALRPRVLVELGTHHGASYLAFCQAVAESNSQCRAYAVDTWAGDPHAGEYGEDVYAGLSDYHAAHYDAFSKLMRMTFDEAAPYFGASSIDLLHIDGLHTYDAVRHDFETWRDKLSDRGVVLFHDIGVREREFGVWRFWAECKERFPHFEFTHSHGLGVLAVGPNVPDAVTHLCSLEGASRSVVASLFARLGASTDDRIERQRLVTALAHERSAGPAIEHVRAICQDLQHVLRQDLASVGQSVRHAEASIARTCDASVSSAVAAVAERMNAARAEELALANTRLDEMRLEMRERAEMVVASVSTDLGQIDSRLQETATSLATRAHASEQLLEAVIESLRAVHTGLARWEAARLTVRVRRLLGLSG